MLQEPRRQSEIIAAARAALASMTAAASPGPWTLHPSAKLTAPSGADVLGDAYSWDLEFVAMITHPSVLTAIDALLADAEASLRDVERDDSAALAQLLLMTDGGRHRHALKLATAILEAAGR